MTPNQKILATQILPVLADFLEDITFTGEYAKERTYTVKKIRKWRNGNI